MATNTQILIVIAVAMILLTMIVVLGCIGATYVVKHYKHTISVHKTNSTQTPKLNRTEMVLNKTKAQIARLEEHHKANPYDHKVNGKLGKLFNLKIKLESKKSK